MANGERQTTLSWWNENEDEGESEELVKNWNQIKVQHYLCNANRKKIHDICSSTCFVQQSLQKDSRSSCCKVHWAQAVAFCPSVAPGQPVSKLLRSHRSRDERNEELSLQRVQRVCVICVIMCLSIAILLSLDSMLSLASWFGLSHSVSFYTAFADVQSP